MSAQCLHFAMTRNVAAPQDALRHGQQAVPGVQQQPCGAPNPPEGRTEPPTSFGTPDSPPIRDALPRRLRRPARPHPTADMIEVEFIGTTVTVMPRGVKT